MGELESYTVYPSSHGARAASKTLNKEDTAQMTGNDSHSKCEDQRLI